MAIDATANRLDFYIDGPTVIYYGQQNCDATDYISPTSSYTVGASSFQYGTLLGFTDGGASISYQLMTHRINGDEYGGNEGMPAELLILGGTASIRAQIVKWAPNAFNQLITGANAMSSMGEIPRLGAPYFTGKYGYSFWVFAKNEGKAYYFPKCELATQPKQWNISSLERRFDLNVLAYNVFTKKSVDGKDVISADVFFSATGTFPKVDGDCDRSFSSGT